MQDQDHTPVLLQPTLTLLTRRAGIQPAPPLCYADATAGLGGHAAALAPNLPPRSTIILNDLDPVNLDHAAARVAAAAPHLRTLTHRGNFAALPRWVTAGNAPPIDLLLADLGFASPQVDDPSRGLSFLRDGPLDMRLSGPAADTRAATAAELIASLSEQDLAQIIFEYGDERHARAIARAVVAARKAGPITTTSHFADIVRDALRGKVPPRQVTGTDPATKTFQALRIAVNDELGNLEALLDQIEKAAAKPAPWLSSTATIAFITFHSLEDRPVKHTFQRLVAAGQAHDLTRKPITADDTELAANPRARSAKLRAVRLTGLSNAAG